MYKNKKLADKNTYLKSDELENIFKVLDCETCKKDLNIINKTSQFKSTKLIENEVISRTNNHLSDRTFIFLN